MSEKYSPEWFANFHDRTLRSAHVIVPLVKQFISPHSVADVGCGTGGWLSAFFESGVRDIFGFDGPWVKPEQLIIPTACFTSIDLMQPFELAIKTDLVMCLETAEHLPASSAALLVKNLVNMADVVLFSAAIPNQGGTGHLNEQWPQYWADLFAEHGYVPVDCLRRKIWTDENVSYWYAQNILFFVKKTTLPSYPAFQRELLAGNNVALPLVHPKKYLSLYLPKPSLVSRVMGKGKRILARVFSH